MLKKLEALANVAVIITSIVLCSVLVKKYLLSPKPSATAGPVSPKPPAQTGQQRQQIKPGTKVSLPGIDWSTSSRTLVLALSTGCHFCSESAPFYQKLEQQRIVGLRLVAVLPQPVNDGKNYLNKLGVQIDDVVQASLDSVGVSGTPTLLLIDHDGAVTDSWVGKLSDGEAAQVINRINGNTAQ